MSYKPLIADMSIYREFRPRAVPEWSEDSIKVDESLDTIRSNRSDESIEYQQQCDSIKELAGTSIYLETPVPPIMSDEHVESKVEPHIAEMKTYREDKPVTVPECSKDSVKVDESIDYEQQYNAITESTVCSNDFDITDNGSGHSCDTTRNNTTMNASRKTLLTKIKQTAKKLIPCMDNQKTLRKTKQVYRISSIRTPRSVAFDCGLTSSNISTPGTGNSESGKKKVLFSSCRVYYTPPRNSSEDSDNELEKAAATNQDTNSRPEVEQMINYLREVTCFLESL